MELVATIWDATKCLCDCTAKHAAFISHLEDNLQSLTHQRTLLQNRTQDVKSRVHQAETKAYMRRTREVDGWLQSVNSMEKTIEDIRRRGAKADQDKCLGKFCHKNCLSSYSLGKEVVKTLDLVKELMDKGQRFDSDSNITYEQPCELVDDMPIPKTVGMDSMLKKVWDSIEEENVHIIGLYGMGGAGKTTLVKILNNEFAKRRSDFTLVIWVVVSKDYDINKIMEDIRKKCQIGDINWKDKSRDEKAREIYNVMKLKKFILLLDDVWDGLELHSIGVPHPYDMSNQSKVLFTTRFENVCDQMQAKKFKVECLTKEEAFELFCMKVGEETIKSDLVIRELAKELMQECKGLPLALITIGRAMAGRKNPQTWKHAIKELKNFPSEVKDMEKEVFFTLKFSYDSLPSAIHKICFLYFALFPEDDIIYTNRLISLWIGEGLLGNHDSIQDAMNHSEEIVESLKLACLLEDYEYKAVKMHDVIRDMALWLVRDQNRNRKLIVVQDEALRSSQETWKITERIAMVYYDNTAEVMTWHVPICPHLVTLIVRGNISMKDFANVQFMSKLRVLSLWRIEGITTLPAEIGLLIHLEYLELRNLKIEKMFPIEMKNLKKLKMFLLYSLEFGLEIIPLEVISCLKSLRSFVFWGERFMNVVQGFLPHTAIPTHLEEGLFLEQLELLPLLEVLSITLETPVGINKLLRSTKLQHSVRRVGILQCGTSINTPIMTTMANMERLEVIQLVGLQYNLEESYVNHIDMFTNLRIVEIFDCHSIIHLTWLKYAPILRLLELDRCNIFEEVIMETADDKERENIDDMFTNLAWMVLKRLPNLRSISRKALPFPKLECIWIKQCPNLKNLPLDFNSATKTLKEIKGETQWWDNLEWENPTIKNLFHAKFIEW